MRFVSIIPALTMLVVTGCDSGSVISNSAAVETVPIENTANGTGGQNSVLATFSGATFVAVGADQSTVDSASGVGSVSFTSDTVSWTQSEIVFASSFVQTQSNIVEVGSYEDDGSAELVASFPGRDVTFAADGGNLVWDSLRYRRAVGSPFNSQDSLVAFLDGSMFNTSKQFDIAGGQSNDQALTSWSVRFDGDQVFWAERGGTVLVGTFSIVDDSSFTMHFSNREVTVVALDRDELVIDAEIYEKDVTNQFDSQESLIDFLDNASYVSTGLQDVGDAGPGAVALGFWNVDFSGDTFTWSNRGITEAGTISFRDTNQFSAVLPDRNLIIEVDGDDFLWDGVRYRRVFSE